MEDDSHVSDAIGVSAQDVDKGKDLEAHPFQSAGDRDLVNEILQFLASATPETLSALAILLSLCIYVVLGRIGLVLIGVLIGILIHASWDRPSTSSEGKTQRRTGLEIVNRLLYLRSTETRDSLAVDELKPHSESFQAFRPETERALDELVEVTLEYMCLLNNG
jgi:hypothetical protein